MKKLLLYFYSDLILISALVQNQEIIKLDISHRSGDFKNKDGWIFLAKRNNKAKQFQKKFVDIGIEKAFLNEDFTKDSPEFILVQVKRNSKDIKNILVTTKISLKGNFMLLITREKDQGQIKFSRKITLKNFRNSALKLKKFIAPDLGIIVRQHGENSSFKELLRDYRRLEIRWRFILKKSESMISERKIGCIFSYNQIQSSLRELRDVKTIETNNIPKTEFFVRGVESFKEASLSKIENISIEILKQILETLKKEVSMKKLGFLSIDKGEMGWMIDVNSGSKLNEENFEEIYLKSNLEAMSCVAKQIRFRDMTGIIAIDTINLISQKNRYKVTERLRQDVLDDWHKVKINNMDSEGIIILIRESRASKSQITQNEIDLLRILIEADIIMKNDGKNSSIFLSINRKDLLNFLLSKIRKIDRFFAEKKWNLAISFNDNDTGSKENFNLSKCSREDSNL